MELKTYVFLYRGKESLKRIPAKQWQAFLRGQLALPGIHQPQLNITEIQILMDHCKPQDLHSIKAWTICVDLQGLMERAESRDLPKPPLSILIGDLFQSDAGNSSVQIEDIEKQFATYLETLFSESVQEQSLYPLEPPSRQVERFIEQMCLA